MDMTKFERWYLRRVFCREVRQGYFHDLKIEGLYRLVREPCDQEFIEENRATMDVYLRERFEITQLKNVCHEP